MIPQKYLQKTTCYIHGAHNPVGIWQNKKFPIYIDSIALEHDFIVCSAGEVGRSIKVAPQELADFVHAHFVEIRE